MRKFAFLMLLLLTAFGAAQMSNREMLLGKKIFVALRPDCKTELKITEEQNRKILDTFGDTLQIDGDRMMISITDGSSFDQMAKDALKVLDKDQTKRLNELWIQQSTGNAIADEEVSKELKLTDDQKKKIDKLVDDAGSQLSDLFMNHDDSTPKKAKEITTLSGKKMTEVLSEEQKKAYDVMKGKEFKFKQPGG